MYETLVSIDHLLVSQNTGEMCVIQTEPARECMNHHDVKRCLDYEH